jgi:hypothetical protein
VQASRKQFGRLHYNRGSFPWIYLGKFAGCCRMSTGAKCDITSTIMGALDVAENRTLTAAMAFAVDAMN